MQIHIEQLRQTLADVQRIVESLERHFPSPDFVLIGGKPFFRHRSQDDLLLSHLKCVRSVSSLNACIVLLEHGYFQEIGTLCRCIDDFNQDVTFLSTPLGIDAPSEPQTRMVQEFFQEEFDNIDNVLRSTQERNRVPRSKVLAGIARINGQPLNPSDTQEIYRTVQQSFSGYVHGAYPHIMESYGGSPSNLHYHMNGMLGTTRIPEWTETLLTYIYRTMIAVEVVAKRCDDAEALTAIRATRLALEQATGVGLDDPRELLAQSKRK